MEQILNYDIILDLLLEQYKDSTNFKALIQADDKQANDIEQALFEIRDLYTLENATGVQLDVIGSIFNLTRDGKTDTEFRVYIQQVISIGSSGTPESIIAALKALYGASYVTYTPEYPGKYRVNTDAEITLEELQSLSPAGVQGFLLCYILSWGGDNLVDYYGNKIGHVSCSGIRETITDGNGLDVTDGNGDSLTSFEYTY